MAGGRGDCFRRRWAPLNCDPYRVWIQLLTYEDSELWREDGKANQLKIRSATPRLLRKIKQNFISLRKGVHWRTSGSICCSREPKLWVALKQLRMSVTAHNSKLPFKI